MAPNAETTLDPDPVLSTTEAAELFDVHPSTVKRWCDRQELDCRRTAGGHRRIPLSRALERARAEGVDLRLLAFEERAGRVWEATRAARERDFDPTLLLAVECLDDDAPERFGEFLIHVSADAGVDLSLFLDEALRPTMERIGDRWEEGRIRVGEEHLVSEVVTRALDRVRRPTDGDAQLPTWSPVALVGSVEGERHVLGARCVRLVLERSGWRVRFLGADVPMEEWNVLARLYGARMLCISFSSLRREGDVLRCVRRLSEGYDPEHPYALALGGAAPVEGPPTGRWPFTALRFFPATRPFAAWLGEAPADA